MRRSMSRRSVTRSAISPPMLVNTATNCSTAACTASTIGAPPLSDLRTAPRSPLSRARPALAVNTSAAAPEALAGLLGEAVDHALGRVVVRRQGGVRVGKPPSPNVRSRPGDLAPDAKGGRVRDTRDDGRARCRVSHGAFNSRPA